MPPEAPLRVVIIDDSPFVRLTLRRILSDAGFRIVATAGDGLEGVHAVRAHRPDVVTLDINMPNMDGLEALKLILADQWVPVVMCSTLTKRGADITMECLAAGAVDFIEKPSNRDDWQRVARILPIKLRAAARAKPRSCQPSGAQPAPAEITLPPDAPAAAPLLTVIASSTGGPGALEAVLSKLPADYPTPILITQHMPPHFTRSLAERLDRTCQISCVEAEPGMIAEPGCAYVAPGGFHLLIRPDFTLATDNKTPPLWGVRPAADIMFRSAADAFGPAIIAVVLTGMGCDGADGCQAIREKGGLVIAESSRTAVIYGMPKAVAERGLAHLQLDLDQIPLALTRAAQRQCSRRAA